MLEPFFMYHKIYMYFWEKVYFRSSAHLKIKVFIFKILNWRVFQKFTACVLGISNFVVSCLLDSWVITINSTKPKDQVIGLWASEDKGIYGNSKTPQSVLLKKNDKRMQGQWQQKRKTRVTLGASSLPHTRKGEDRELLSGPVQQPEFLLLPNTCNSGLRQLQPSFFRQSLYLLSPLLLQWLSVTCSSSAVNRVGGLWGLCLGAAAAGSTSEPILHLHHPGESFF